MGFNVHDPGNMLLLVAAAEKKLDQFHWTLKPLPLEMHEVDGVTRLMHPYKVCLLGHLCALVLIGLYTYHKICTLANQLCEFALY